MKPVTQWLADHPWVLSAFAIGMTAGFLFFLPLVPWTIPDSAATMLGSALGAFIAVGLAAWYPMAQEKKRDMQIRLQMAHNGDNLSEKLRRFLAEVDEWMKIEGGKPKYATPDLIGACDALKITYGVFRRRFEAMRPEYYKLGTPGVIYVSDVERAMDFIHQYMSFHHLEFGIELALNARHDEDRQAFERCADAIEAVTRNFRPGHLPS